MKFPMDRPVKVVMLGAGGTGGYVAPYVFRLLQKFHLLPGSSGSSAQHFPCTLQIFLWMGHLVAVISGCWQPQDSVSDGKHA